MRNKKKQSENIQVDVNALHIMDQESPEFEFTESIEGVRKFRMVGYSGKIIRGHWYWDNLAIDLEGIAFKKPKFPILRDHMTNAEMGFSKKPQVSNEEGLVFTEKEVTFLENEDVDKFVENSKKGFPYQASISGRPTVIERVEEGSSVEVNGYTLKGPGTVWRKTDFKECSICVFGYDDQTSAQAFSSSGHNVDIEVENITDEMEGLSMDLIKLKEESPKEYEALMAEVSKAAEEKMAAAVTDAVGQVSGEFQAQLDEKDKQIASLTTEKTGLSEDLTKTGDRLLSLEKKDALREEADLDSQVESVWLTALAASGLPTWLYPKVKKQVTRSKFMADGAFDKGAFTKAVEAEITDWETQSGQEAEGEVEGFGIVRRGAEGSSSDQFQSDSIVDRMLGYVGQTSEASH